MIVELYNNGIINLYFHFGKNMSKAENIAQL